MFSNNILESGAITTLDPAYTPSIGEWMGYGVMTEWEFYCNGTYLTVQMSREHTLTDLKKPGAYLLSTIAESETNYFRGYVDPQDRVRWKELLMSQISLMTQARAKLEAELRKKGGRN